jgi:hypothetical protein
MLGTNDIGGTTGLGQYYALANQAARTGRDVQLGQQYTLAREQQKRADIDWLTGQVNEARNAAMGGINQQAGAYQAPMQWGQVAGNAISSGLTAYGALKKIEDLTNNQTQPASTQTPAWSFYTPPPPNYVQRPQ